MKNQPTPDETLQHLIAGALSPLPVSDAHIDQLDETDYHSAVDEMQLQRVSEALTQLQDADRSGRIQSRSGGARLVQVPTGPGNRGAEQRYLRRQNPNRRGAVAALVVSALSLLGVLMFTSEESVRQQQRAITKIEQQRHEIQSLQRNWMVAKAVTPSAGDRVVVGDVITTRERERRRVLLPDGSILYVNESSAVTVATDRRLTVDQGEVFVEVVPQFGDDEQRELFEIVTPTRTMTALGTKFGVDATGATADVVVTQGKVKVSGVKHVVEAGQVLVKRKGKNGERSLLPSERVSERLSWTRDLMTAAATPLVPVSEHAGGSIISVDPNGQEMKLSLRKYHVDVHIEDGFARTTIDQTYFNHTQQRLEGTFRFPLPPDASLSRLAMYVGSTLMEGGMAERQHARNTFEKIVHKMQDPALLEWVDGTTFRMRVFPLEARQEKRIVLSYTQRLSNAYGKTYYRFPAGHSMDGVREWSTSIRVQDGAHTAWHSPSHKLTPDIDEADLVLAAEEKNSRMDRDVVLELREAGALQREKMSGSAKWTMAQHEGRQYLMLRYRPELPGKMKRSPRHWIFLFEAAADRNPLLARTQIEILRTLLDNAEHSDTFHVVTSNTVATVMDEDPNTCSAANINKVIKHLERTHLIGALDLEKALNTAAGLASGSDGDGQESVVVHLGSAIPVLGQQDQHQLLELLPDNAAYVGVGVGKLWSQSFMKEAASRTGGYFTQVNPDEEVHWRAFELSSLLNTPRLLRVGVERKTGKGKTLSESEWRNFAETVVQGEEICAVTRLKEGQKLPKSVTVTGLLDSQPWKRTVRVRDVANDAAYLPRTWAKLEIDRLIADGAAEHKNEIIRLSKSMYVMSPFTSLLVLENEEMYTKYNIDRGRKDHWALYPCPDEIKVVHEPVERREDMIVEQTEPTTDWSTTLRRLGSSPLKLAPVSPADISFSLSPDVDKYRHLIYLSDGATVDEPRDNLLQFFAMPRGNSDDEWSVNLTRDFITNYARPRFESDRGANQFGWHAYTNDALNDDFLVDFDVGQNGNGNANGNRRFDGGWYYRSYGEPKSHHWSMATPQIRFGEEEVPVIASFDSGLWLSAPVNGSVRFTVPDYGAMTGLALPQTYGLAAAQAVKNAEVTPPYALSGGFAYKAPFYPYSAPLPGGWAQQTLEWNDGAWDLEFSERAAVSWRLAADDDGLQDSVWVDPIYVPRGQDRLSVSDLFEGSKAMVAPLPQIHAWDRYQDVSNAVSSAPIRLQMDLGARQHVFFEQEREQFRLQVSAYKNLNESEAKDVDSLNVWARLPEVIPTTHNVNSWREHFHRRSVVPVAGLSQRVSVNFQSTSLWHVLQYLTVATGVKTSVHPALANQQVTLRVNGIQLRSAIMLLLSQVDGIYRVAANGSVEILPRGNMWPLTIDLMAHAPALNTSQADVLAIAANEMPDDQRPVRGDVDKRAQKLIERARVPGWERVTFPASDGQPAFSVLCDGAGRHVYNRTVSEGLNEHVVCDGDALVHTYAELGLASRRAYSRFHRRALASVVPWLVPPVDELSLGADVRLVNENTIAVVPRPTADAKDRPSHPLSPAGTQDEVDDRLRGRGEPESAESIDDEHTSPTRQRSVSERKTNRQRRFESAGRAVPLFETHLVFGDDGRLVERRLVVSESQAIVWRAIYRASGQIRLLAGDGEEVSTVELKRNPAEAPDLAIHDEQLVVLPMPIRSSEFLRKKTAADAADDVDSLNEQQLLALILAYSAEGKGVDVAKLVHQHFFSKGDRRDGLYVLLSRFPHNLTWEENVADSTDEKQTVDLRPSAEGSPLRQFLRQAISHATASDATGGEFDIDGDSDGFVQRLAMAWNIHHRWSTGEAVKDRTQAQIRKELNEAIDYVADCRTDELGWTLLSVIQPKIEAGELHDLFAAAAERFEDNPVLTLLVRQERVRSLFKAGKHKKARRLYSQLIVAVARHGVMPRIDPEIRSQFLKNDGQDAWDKLIANCGTTFVKAGLLRTAFGLSAQLHKLGDIQHAAGILDDVLTDATVDTRPDVLLAAVEHLRRLADGRADELLAELLEVDRLQNDPGFWRYASQVAEDLGHKQVALRRLEQAIHLEFVNRPKMVNVEKLRQTYSALMSRYEAVIDASATLETPVPHDLYARVIRAADQWRLMEDDPTTCCHTTAGLLSKLGHSDLSWCYLTTPLAGRSGESAPWKTLAENLTEQSQSDLADLAWTKAFEFEQTNPEILLSHAKMLQSVSRTQESSRLLRQIVDANWQPRFNNTRQQARTLLGTMTTGNAQ